MRYRFMLALLPILLFAGLSGMAAAHTVTLTLAVHVNSTVSNTIRVNDTEYTITPPAIDLVFTNLSKKYISANNTTSIAALVSAGQLLSARVNTGYNSTHYMLQMKQDSGNNRFLIAATNGTYADIENRLSMVEAFHIVSSTFGNFVTTAPRSLRTFIRLDYTTLDLDFPARWSGSGQLRIRNNGNTNRGIPNITLEVIR